MTDNFEKDINVPSKRPDWRITLQADHIKRLEQDLDFERTKRKSLQADLKEKEQECEELKNKVKLYEEILQRNTQGFKTGYEASMFSNMVNGVVNSIRDKKLFKLKATLTEIKEIAEKHKATAHCCYLEDMTEILQKISEVEEWELTII